MRIRAHSFDLDLMVHIWSSWFTFGAHVFDLELMAQRVSITSFFLACCDRGFWACCDFLGMQPVQGFTLDGNAIGSEFEFFWACCDVFVCICGKTSTTTSIPN